VTSHPATGHSEFSEVQTNAATVATRAPKQSFGLRASIAAIPGLPEEFRSPNPAQPLVAQGNPRKLICEFPGRGLEGHVASRWSGGRGGGFPQANIG
jgi:hypothetical protein